MRLLWMCPFFPYPPDNGSRIREYNLIKHLSTEHDITLLSLIQSDGERAHAQEMQNWCSSVVPVLPESRLDGRLDGRRGIADVFSGLINKDPRHFYGAGSANVIESVSRLIDRNEYHAVVVDTLFMTNYLWPVLRRGTASVVLVQHNVETLVQKQQFQLATGLAGKLRKWVYYRSFAGFEHRACQLCAHVVVVSERERRHLLEVCPQVTDDKVSVVPNGVDADLCLFAAGDPAPDSLVYPGAVTYDANLDAMEYFTTGIWPLVKSERPGAQLRITGNAEGVNVDGLAMGNGVTLTGYVEDIHSLVAQSWACIVPLRMGGGSRLKILEAMALGTPVVSTSKGAEGLDVTCGRDILIADEPAQFAAEVVRLLSDPRLRTEIGSHARRMVAERYSWAAFARQLDRVLDQVASRRSRQLERRLLN